MKEIDKIHISVRNLVELVLRSGSINSRYISSNRATDGIRLHQKIQKSRKKIAKLNNYEYISEFKLVHAFDYENFIFDIEGRADGIIIDNDYIAIEEIKTTIMTLDNIQENSNPVHWAQVQCYAYIYAFKNNLDSIYIELTYCNVDTEEVKTFKKSFYFDELKIYFYSFIENYIIWAKMLSNWKSIRNVSIKALNFPYEQYRKGQRELSVAVYKTIIKKKKLFIQAPTGTGKTISTIFPTIKAVSEGHCSKIFYLTARTITRQTAEEAFYLMKQKGLKFKTITLTAKEKICFCKESSCTPEQCIYANGHFNRVNEAIMDILENECQINRVVIEKYSKKYIVCPFEFSLDITLWCDCIICDYNYVFDPKVYLKRFFQDNYENDYIFLIDEAHNLVDRARDMFSASINKKMFLKIKKHVKNKNVSKSIKKINDYMLNIIRDTSYDEIGTVNKEQSQDLYIYIKDFIKNADQWFVKNEGNEYYQEFLECYFKSLDFIHTSDFYDDRYVTYTEVSGHDVNIKLFCLDPSYLLQEVEKRSKASILFSATLTPLDYFREILGGNKEDFFIKLSSPFKHKNLEIIVAGNISTLWKNRKSSYEKIAEYLYIFSNEKSGNYLVFFPSYQYMNDVYNIFKQNYTMNTVLQNNSMSEEQREEYLMRFSKKNEKSLLGFAVMGGIFSEGIDLVGDKLIGVAIIGVGLPQLSMERNIIADYYKNSIGKGYEYAYMYPGMNKVMQAAGRVIRTENDRGVIMLVDERFLFNDYKELFPYEWGNYKKIYNEYQLKKYLSIFWNIK